MKKNPQMPSARRILGMVVGIVIIGLGIALFKQSHLGNDSISALNMRLAEMLGISLGVQNLCTNILFFALQFWFGRKYIGLGTFVNGIGVGFIVTAFYDPIAAHFGPAEALGLPVQLLWVALAVPVTALGASLYQTADLGIAPYDYLSLGLRDYTPVPYFGCRVFTDAQCLPGALHPVLQRAGVGAGAALQAGRPVRSGNQKGVHLLCGSARLLLCRNQNLNSGVPASTSPSASIFSSPMSSPLVTMMAVAVGWPAARMASRSTFSSGVPAETF